GRWVHSAIPRLRSFRAIRPWPDALTKYAAPLLAALGRLEADLARPRVAADWTRPAFLAHAAAVLLRWHRWPIGQLVERLADLGRLRQHHPADKLHEPATENDED